MALKKLYLDRKRAASSDAVLFQYAVEEGPITLYEVWRHPIGETLDLIEWFCDACRRWLQSLLRLVHGRQDLHDLPALPARLDSVRAHQRNRHASKLQAQNGPCVKPAAALDLMLHSRKGPYQALMAREDIRIKRVPTALAHALRSELETSYPTRLYLFRPVC